MVEPGITRMLRPVVILGPTAGGKSELAVMLAERLRAVANGEAGSSAGVAGVDEASGGTGGTGGTGGSRGFGTTCGHFYDNWKNDDFRRLMLNAIAWCAKVEVPAEGVAAKYYEHDEITASLEGVTGTQRAIAKPAKPANPTM